MLIDSEKLKEYINKRMVKIEQITLDSNEKEMSHYHLGCLNQLRYLKVKISELEKEGK